MRNARVLTARLIVAVGQFLWRHKYHVGASLLILAWCWPYFTSGNRIEWGDFSFFAQGYEAIRISILEYGQFPWFNPWIAGGVPLYANPQFGVFSIQTPLVLLFGAPMGLKLAIVLYTFAGYASMNLLLRRYFKVGAGLAVLLSLIWIFSTFFVAHLPAHFTFVWYLLAPLYVYLALTMKDWRGGVLLGAAFAIMALSAVHNPLFHIGMVVGGILAVRLVFERKNWRRFAGGLGAAAAVVAVVAGHRILFAARNVRDFPRDVGDPILHPIDSALGLLLPFSTAHDLSYLRLPPAFGERTSFIGFFATIAVLLAILFIVHRLCLVRHRLTAFRRDWLLHGVILAAAGIFFAIGLGAIHPVAPYSLMGHLPVLGEMRMSGRWFLWVSLALIVFLAISVHRSPKKSFFRTASHILITLGVAELFLLNIGYQHYFLRNDPVTPSKATAEYTFAQTGMFGSALELPDGTIIADDGKMPRFFREYEATLFNTGALQANDSLVYQLPLKDSPRCGWEEGCSLVLSANADVAYWSPNKIVLKRTGPGDIELNMNNSNYFLVNGQRDKKLRTAEPFLPFIIHDPSDVITIKVQPTITTLLRRF